MRQITKQLIKFVEPSLRNSQCRAAIRNRLQRLYLHSWDPMDARALIASIPLQKGACLDISICGTGLKEVLYGIPTTHLLNLQSPTFMEYRFTSGRIRLQGPNGIFSFCGPGSRVEPFADLGVSHDHFQSRDATPPRHRDTHYPEKGIHYLEQNIHYPGLH